MTDQHTDHVDDVEMWSTHPSWWYWTCRICGWLGVDCPSEEFARREGAEHVRQEHS